MHADAGFVGLEVINVYRFLFKLNMVKYEKRVINFVSISVSGLT
jgi:hypothetical protein